MSNQLLFLLHQKQNDIETETDQKAQRTSFRTQQSQSRSQYSKGSRKVPPPKAPKNQPYISPFVKKANEIANQRAQVALRKLKRNIPQNHDDNKPDVDFHLTSEYFDPHLKRKEIFKIEPRNKVVNNDEKRRVKEASSFKKQISTDMTRRTYGVSFAFLRAGRFALTSIRTLLSAPRVYHNLLFRVTILM